MQNILVETCKTQEALNSLAASFKETELSITEKALNELSSKPKIPEITAWNWSKSFQEI
ncbi:darobactin family peptide antibiotic [Photorhabdus heterorhabditis]|uniref:darobactin family peptide antibiotic n=1 Tax=Photorhabdus heterorhabditis TaxID=880156 RepID=UPI000AC5422F|nr:darobactin family peptide antibiotic [Photorhabdus heterorhabditis]NRN30205.1 darobactin family peptide antibiotic [Photorhabdus heterorhabditis subsp. aluminescens]